MTWEIKEQNTVVLRLQDRFIITYEQLEFFSEEFQEGLDGCDCILESKRFAEFLFRSIGDHLSRRNLKDIISECEQRLENWE